MAALPSGTVTFLFTDIEGSTTRWEHHREQMQAALARHDELLRAAITAHGGHVFKTVGDAFYASFATAPKALETALAAQRALVQELWSPECPIRVRMALHTGAAEERDGDYFGTSLNRVARLLAAGHGEQVLLSEVTYGLVRDEVPAGVQLRDLGEHRLKDLIRPEHVYQVVAPHLPSAFPPLRSLDSRPHNLPVQPTPFMGRERESEAVRERLLVPETRLLTLTGVGGSGKTRLALQVAAEVLDTFADGVFFVSLASLSDPSLVLPTVAQSLGVVEVGGQPLRETLRAYLREQHLLLVLDNFEQVLEAAPAVAEVLAVCPALKVLVTSRAALHVRGEREVPVPPLAVPDVHHLPPVPVLSQYEAVRLFIERAQDVRPDFAVTNENAPVVAEICARLDGLPLALELAAARLRLLSPQALLARLGSRLKLLTGGARDLPARQQTLRATLDWSFSLLTEVEQTLFARLAVFVGGCTLEAVQAICTGTGDVAMDALEGLSLLVDKSLVRPEVGDTPQEGGDGEPRFGMLETVREYGLERLTASGERQTVQWQHAAYYLALTEQAEPHLKGQGQAVWLARLEREHDNLRAALRWARESEEVEIGLRLAGALWRFWEMRGHLSEGRAWLNALLTLSGSGRRDGSAGVRAKALHGAGALAFRQGDYEQAVALSEDSLALWRELEDKQGIAGALNNLGIVEIDRGNWGRASMLHEECLALYRDLGDKRGIATALDNLGMAMRCQGDPARAAALHEQSLALFQDLEDRGSIAIVLTNLGDAVRDQSDYERAAGLYAQSLVVYQQVGNMFGVAACLEGLAGVATVQGQPERAAHLLGAAESLRQSIGAPLPPAERVAYTDIVDATRVGLEDDAFTAAWTAGRELPLEQATAEALAGAVAQPRSSV